MASPSARSTERTVSGPATGDPLPILVATIVEVGQPEQVILFGSRAIGTAKQDSDYDFLVVVRDGPNERELASRIYRALLARRLGVAVDVIVVNDSVLARNKDNPLLIYHRALREGRVMHERPAGG
ncbi:MAG: nucleotidyltransferase domain-containing protein [Anaerolineae bacterium]